ncbi:asparagine synthase (glutamine-hydrolyzing) [Rhodospirillales bacterium]|nr:asparagine synthase (glutamine-hydrolyzing) [Rhodospirillales bacterium]
MCGLWSSLGFLVDRSAIDLVEHRGPDDSGWEVVQTSKGPLSLGSRRLAIIDVSESGAQPMHLPKENLSIVYNGEVYNHAVLRDELKKNGYTFTSLTDTEVVLTAYAHWGIECLEHFKGMFALVIWDHDKDCLFVARDRFGIKPLYWFADGGGIAFSSEVKQFASVPGFNYRISKDVAYEYLSTGITDHRRETMFSDVYQLMAGECVVLNLKTWQFDEEPHVQKWYDLEAKMTDVETGIDLASSQFYDLLKCSVQEHLVSDVEVGSCLSGGLDSSTIIALASENKALLRSVTAFFEDAEINEKAYADDVIQNMGIDGAFVEPSLKGLISNIDAMHYSQDFPTASSSVFAQWCVFDAARKIGIKVMLDGQGADEQLGGYSDSVNAYHAGLIRNGKWIRFFDELLARPLGQSPVSGFARALISALPTFIQRLIRRIRGLETPEWLNAEFSAGRVSVLPSRNNLSAMSRDHFLKSSLPALLRYEDRNSMAHSIEARVPFLDHHIVEFLQYVPHDQKISKGVTKFILRRAIENFLPSSVVWRQDKIGFATPQSRWLSTENNHLVKESVFDVLNRFPGIFDESKLREMLENINNKNVDHQALWRICSFSSWTRVFQATLE